MGVANSGSVGRGKVFVKTTLHGRKGVRPLDGTVRRHLPETLPQARPVPTSGVRSTSRRQSALRRAPRRHPSLSP